MKRPRHTRIALAAAALFLAASSAGHAETFHYRQRSLGLLGQPASPGGNPAPAAPAPTLVAAQTAWSFQVKPTQVVSQQATLSNSSSTLPLTITSATLTGPWASEFALSGCPAGTVLAPSATCTLTASFSPGVEAGASGKQATATLAYAESATPLTLSFTGDSTYAAATPSNPNGATLPTITAYSADWASGASYGGFTVGGTYRIAGRYIVGFAANPSYLGMFEFNVSTADGGYYGVSLATGRVVRGGASITGGSANGTVVSGYGLSSGDVVVMAIDYYDKSVTWYKCSSLGTCAAKHTATNLTASTIRPYLWKGGSGAASVTILSRGVQMDTVPAGFHNGLPQ